MHVYGVARLQPVWTVTLLGLWYVACVTAPLWLFSGAFGFWFRISAVGWGVILLNGGFLLFCHGVERLSKKLFRTPERRFAAALEKGTVQFDGETHDCASVTKIVYHPFTCETGDFFNLSLPWPYHEPILHLWVCGEYRQIPGAPFRLYCALKRRCPGAECRLAYRRVTLLIIPAVSLCVGTVGAIVFRIVR